MEMTNKKLTSKVNMLTIMVKARVLQAGGTNLETPENDKTVSDKSMPGQKQKKRRKRQTTIYESRRTKQSRKKKEPDIDYEPTLTLPHVTL